MDRLSKSLTTAAIAFASVAAPARTAAQVAPPSATRPVAWKLLLPNMIDDQKHIWSFPSKLAHGHDWIATAAVLGATAGLVAIDPTEGRYFRRTSTFQGFNSAFTSNATVIGTIVAPVSLYAAGLKDTTRRARPTSIPPGGNFSDSWFESGGSALRGNGGFPSGHTIAAFSVATVVARRYGNHRWVPCAAYGLAAAVAFSRLSLSAHFASDVFMGAALGYSIGRFAVLRQ